MQFGESYQQFKCCISNINRVHIVKSPAMFSRFTRYQLQPVLHNCISVLLLFRRCSFWGASSWQRMSVKLKSCSCLS